MAEHSFRVGAVPDLYCRPLVYGLEHQESPASAGLSVRSAGENAEALLQEELDAAYIGPVDFARNSSDFSLYPSVGVSSLYDSRSVILCVNHDVRKISTVAVGPVSSTDIILGKIVLAEKFEQEFSLVPMIAPVEEMLKKADAALLAGDGVLSARWTGPKLDLVDEWSDMTELPFVHLVCAARKEKQRQEIGASLVSSQERGVASLTELSSAYSAKFGMTDEEVLDQLERYSYGFDDDARQSLGEFFRYAFYLGIFPDVPEIEVFEGK